MSRITGVVVALATTAAVLTGSTVGAEPAPAAAPAAELPKEITGGVELAMADGDRLRLWATADYRAVVSRRWDAATATWGPRVDVVRDKQLRCGRVDARTANGAVAAIALCDEGGYYEDTAPVSSQALWSPDGVTWSAHTLDGEAYEEPGISPDGQNAVWPLYQRYTTRTGTGFTDHPLRADGQEYSVTATITDTAQVTFVHGTCAGRASRLVVQTRTGDAAPTRQEVRAPFSCTEVDLANVDSDTVWLGNLREPAQTTTVSRPDATSPWAVTRVAPVDAPGLFQTWRALDRQFVTAPGLPLLALGSRSRRRVLAQSYDPETQAWRPPTTVFSARERCSWSDRWTAEPLGVLAVGLVCGDNEVVLTTQDGETWRAVRGDWHRRGLSPDGTYVALPARTRTYVISPELGVVTLPGGVPGRCDVVVPDGPDGAVLLTSAGRHRGWPTVLQHSSPDGWSRLSRTSLPTPPRDCRAARASTYDLPYRFEIIGGRFRRYTVQILERDDQWTVRRSRY